MVAGNVTTVGLISATGNISSAGNISGLYVIGNGSQLTGLPAGYTNANLATLGSNVISTTGSITGGNITGGNILAGSGVITTTGNITGGNVIFGSGIVSGTGNVYAGNVLGGANVNATTHTGTTVSVTGTVTGATISATGSTVGGVITGTSLSVTGTVTGGNLTTAGILTVNSGNAVTAIVNGGGNTIGNIGSSSSWFGNIFATSSKALYADLAEMYCADDFYPPGTVVEFGGQSEITVTTTSHSTAVAGIISTNPSYLMNSTIACEVNALEVALVGRVPCQVVGTIRKGDRLVSGKIPGVAQAMNPALYEPGCIIGKALEEYNSTTPGTIEVAVGRF